MGCDSSSHRFSHRCFFAGIFSTYISSFGDRADGSQQVANSPRLQSPNPISHRPLRKMRAHGDYVVGLGLQINKSVSQGDPRRRGARTRWHEVKPCKSPKPTNREEEKMSIWKSTLITGGALGTLIAVGAVNTATGGHGYHGYSIPGFHQQHRHNADRKN